MGDSHTSKMVITTQRGQFEHLYRPELDAIVHRSAGITSVAHCLPGNLICSAGEGAIFLVRLSGEQNTMIHDEMTRCSSMNNYEDRSHSVVKLFDNTIYMLRIQLDCVESWDYGNSYKHYPSLVETNCNVPHYIDVWIDLNDDGIFDQNKERFLNNDQRYDGSIKRDHDLNIAIPKIDGKNYLDGPHRMRIILTRDENNRKPCYNAGYGEARDYTVHIIRKPYY